jgi:uncharacterized membrane protein YGL010W
MSAYHGARPTLGCYDLRILEFRIPGSRRCVTTGCVEGDLHKDPRNKLTHFFGVPLVSFSLFLALSWFPFVLYPKVPISVATIFYVGVLGYYLKLDWAVALMQLPVTLTLLLIADWAAHLSFAWSFSIFLAAFVLGWIIQLVGHAIEGRRPALVDNLFQVFNAPLFLAVEVLALLGLRRDLYESESLHYSQSPS